MKKIRRIISYIFFALWIITGFANMAVIVWIPANQILMFLKKGTWESCSIAQFIGFDYPAPNEGVGLWMILDFLHASFLFLIIGAIVYPFAISALMRVEEWGDID